MTRIDAFLIHGIGKITDPHYYDDFVIGIRKNLPIDIDINFHPVDYSRLLEPKEDIIFSWFNNRFWKKLHNFACYYICDVLAYAYTRGVPGPGDFIYDLTELLKTKFRAVDEKYPDSKKIVIGHSLGSIVGFGYTWEEKIDCLITMGSPFDYFSIRYAGFGRDNPDLPFFYNFWKDHDAVATEISKNPNFKRVKDIQVSSWNPKYLAPLRAHSVYWTSDFVHKEIAKIVEGLSLAVDD